MRVVKEAEVRKNEILDAAEELFAQKGFDCTSTNDILEKVGIARGTLYYHFKSKEDVLDGVIDRINSKMAARASQIAHSKEVPLLRRFTATILALNVSSDLDREVLKQIHKPQNALMHQKIQMRILTDVAPIISELVREGIEQGIFNTNYVQELVEMTLLYANVAFDDLMEQTEEEKQQRICGFIYNTERLLGAEKGVLEKSIQEIFQANKEV